MLTAERLLHFMRIGLIVLYVLQEKLVPQNILIKNCTLRGFSHMFSSYYNLIGLLRKKHISLFLSHFPILSLLNLN